MGRHRTLSFCKMGMLRLNLDVFIQHTHIYTQRRGALPLGCRLVHFKDIRRPHKLAAMQKMYSGSSLTVLNCAALEFFSKGKHYLRFILSSSFLELYAKVFLPAAPQGLVVIGGMTHQ